MSAGLDVFIGPAWTPDPVTGVQVDVPFEQRPPLDRQAVEEWLERLPGAEREGSEVYPAFGALDAIVYLLEDDDGVLRSVEAELHGSDDPAFVTELETLLLLLVDLAERLGARVYSPEDDDFIARGDVTEYLSRFV